MPESFVLQYGYLIGALILGLFWFIIFYLRKDLRSEILWMSTLISFGGVTDMFFVPMYWNPGSLFNLIDYVGFGIESIIFSFFAGGIASVTYEVISKKHIRKFRGYNGSYIRLLPVIILLASLAILWFLDFNNHLYSLIVPALIAGFVIIIYRHDLVKEALWGGLYFGTFYLVLFAIFGKIFPIYVERIYNLDNLWGVYLIGVPLEEVLFATAIGICLGPFYEFIKGYRLYSYRGVKVLK